METEYKGYAVYRNREDGTYSVKTIGKGSVPNMLLGKFSSTKLLFRLIDQWKKTNVKNKGKN